MAAAFVVIGCLYMAAVVFGLLGDEIGAAIFAVIGTFLLFGVGVIGVVELCQWMFGG